MEYGNVKEKLSTVNGKRCNYNKFKDEDRFTIGKYAAIHGTAAALIKFKNTFPHYRLTESTIRTMRKKYHRIVKAPASSSPIKKIT